LIQLRIDGYKWSTPFSVSYEGVMRISLQKDVGDEPVQIRVAVRSGAKRSRFEVVFRPDSLSSPYRFVLSVLPLNRHNTVIFSTLRKGNIEIHLYSCIILESPIFPASFNAVQFKYLSNFT